MRATRVFLAALALTGVNAAIPAAAAAQEAPGAVYTMTNAAAGNTVLAFERYADGRLAAGAALPTGGLGSGDGLGNQSAVVLTDNQRWLFVVNPGSHDISSFAVEAAGLKLIDRIPSGGLRPISVTVFRDLLYVLNAGGQAGGVDTISGFRVDPHGTLSPIAGSTQPLSGASTGPAQVSFSPNGRVLVVTEKATNLIDTYVVDAAGVAQWPQSFGSSGVTPFGFAFGKRDVLVVSEAFGGAPDASAVSSYIVGADGTLQTVSASVPTTETAACWLVITNDGRYSYTTNAGSGTISGYRIGFDGTLTRLDADGRTGVTGPGSTPLDMAITGDGRYLYSLNAGDGTLGAFGVAADGSLQAIPGLSGLPAGINGLAAR
jgi:6-phosphogluconolactonase (cycloisomerase 2 family)